MFSNDDPQWTALRAEQEARHGAAIAYIKRQVGAGTEYANEFARAVLSENGAYYQLAEMPEEFVGAVGEQVSHRLVAAAEAREWMARLEAWVEDVARGAAAADLLSLYVLYPGGSLRERRALFVFDHRREAAASFRHGAWQADVPRVVKLRLRCAPGQEPPGFPPSGIVLFLAPSHTDAGHCLLATISRDTDTRDLGLHSAPVKNTRWN